MTAAAGAFDTLEWVGLGELFRRQWPVREFAISPWLYTGESALIWADTGVGKTWLTLSLAVAMAGGGKVWDYEAPKPRRVMIIDGEMNLQEFTERARDLALGGKVRDLDVEALERNISICARQGQGPSARFYDVTDPDDQRRIMQRVNRFKADVVIVDNLTTCADTMDDENSATDFKQVMSFLMKLKAAGKTAILVHHSNKQGDNYRGSSAMAATFEVIIGLKKPPVAREDVASFSLTWPKMRKRGAEGIRRARVWTLEANGWAVQEDEDSLDVRVKAAVLSLKFCSGAEVAEALGVSRSTISRVLDRLDVNGELKRPKVSDAFDHARAHRREEADPFADPTEPLEVDPNADF